MNNEEFMKFSFPQNVRLKQLVLLEMGSLEESIFSLQFYTTTLKHVHPSLKKEYSLNPAIFDPCLLNSEIMIAKSLSFVPKFSNVGKGKSAIMRLK